MEGCKIPKRRDTSQVIYILSLSLYKGCSFFHLHSLPMVTIKFFIDAMLLVFLTQARYILLWDDIHYGDGRSVISTRRYPLCIFHDSFIATTLTAFWHSFFENLVPGTHGTSARRWVEREE